jgi:hypothetical protein
MEWDGHPDHRPRGSGRSARPAPELTTLEAARLGRMSLTVECFPCRRRREVPADRLPRALGPAAVGELWLAGRFRCTGCGLAAGAVAVVVHDRLPVEIERWGVGEPGVAGRLQRWWRRDPTGGRDWNDWFPERGRKGGGRRRGQA